MPERSLASQLEELVAALLARTDAAQLLPGPELAPLLRIAQDLRDLPRKNFKARLKSELERKTSMATQAESLASVRLTATPRMRIKNAEAAIDFYKRAFGAREVMR